MNDFKQKSERENIQFLFLCGKKDRNILLSQKKKYFDDYVRLACISLVIGFKTVFLKISAIADKNADKFLNGLECINGNFLKLNDWVEDFIDNIQIPKAKKLLQEFWQEQKAKLDVENFNVKLLIDL